MRIAIFAETFLPKWDGVANTLCYYLDYLARSGHASLMFAPKGAPSSYANTPIRTLPGLPFPFYPTLKLVPPVFDLTNELRAFRPQIIQLINPAVMSWMGLRHAKQLQTPVVASYHTDLPGYAVRYGMPLFEKLLWRYFRSLHDQADLNYCPSVYTKQQLEAHGFQRVHVWSHGVDCERFSPRHYDSVWREHLTGGHPDSPLLLYVGRLASEKRVEMLREVLTALPQARLAIVGDGPERANLEKVFAGTKTVFTGYLQGYDLSAVYASADLFVFPSSSETFGNVMLEAMAAGLPVVAPDAGGHLDFVVDGKNGALFHAHEQDDLVRVVRELLDNLAWRDTLANQANASALARSWDSANEQLVAEFEALLATRRQASADRFLKLRSRYISALHNQADFQGGYAPRQHS